jgi:hypothetical protein
LLELLEAIDGRIERDHVAVADTFERSRSEEPRPGADVEHDVPFANGRVLEHPIALRVQWTKPVKKR